MDRETITSSNRCCYISEDEAFDALDSFDMDGRMSQASTDDRLSQASTLDSELNFTEDSQTEESQNESQNESDDSGSICTCSMVRRPDCNRLHNETGAKRTTFTEQTRYNLRSSRPCSSQVMRGYAEEKQQETENRNISTLATKQRVKRRSYFPNISIFKTEEDNDLDFEVHMPPERSPPAPEFDQRWERFQERSYRPHRFEFSDDEMERYINTAFPSEKKDEESFLTMIWLWIQNIIICIRMQAGKVTTGIENVIFSLFCLPVRLVAIARRSVRGIYFKISTWYYRILTYLRQFYSRIYNYLNPRKTSTSPGRRYLHVTSSHNSLASRIKTKLLCYRVLYLVLFLFVILFAVGFDRFYMRHSSTKVIGPILHPIDSGIYNGYPLYIDPENSGIPTWYLYPNQQELSSMYPVKEPLKGVTPVIMFLRESGVMDTSELVNLYRILSSFGYHVVVPIDVLTQHDILKTWKWIKSQTDANAYIWGYGINASSLTQNAERFCKNQLPPHGVIIAKEVDDENIYQTMEIWSCNCGSSSRKYSPGGNLKYNYVKCPIVFEEHYVNDVYTQVVTCLETVNKKTAYAHKNVKGVKI